MNRSFYRYYIEGVHGDRPPKCIEGEKWVSTHSVFRMKDALAEFVDEQYRRDRGDAVTIAMPPRSYVIWVLGVQLDAQWERYVVHPKMKLVWTATQEDL